MSRKGKQRRPRVFGLGLIALDRLVGAQQVAQLTSAGGTCGNVLIILSALGWKAFPIAHLKPDEAGRQVLGDLEKWGVRLSFARLPPPKRTPVVVHRILRNRSGKAIHRFSWAIAPSIPLQKRAAECIASRVENPQVLFVDKVFPGAIDIVLAARKRGALIVFEPSGIREPRLFRELAKASHIVKYSKERLTRLSGRRSRHGVLEIETRGREGLRYRTNLRLSKTNGWRTLQGVQAQQVRDSAGAGDWCTAGIIHHLGKCGGRKFTGLKRDDLEGALMFGQSLAAWNVQFEGARGAMRGVSRRTFQRRVHALENGMRF